jgi:hypothetical protein
LKLFRSRAPLLKKQVKTPGAVDVTPDISGEVVNCFCNSGILLHREWLGNSWEVVTAFLSSFTTDRKLVASLRYGCE